MTRRRPQPDPYPVRIGLLITTTHRAGIYHLHAAPVVIGKDAWQQRYSAEQTDRDPYADITPETISNPRDTINGRRLACLTITAQGNDDDAPRYLYAWEIAYRDAGSIDTTIAKQMHRTLAGIEARLDRETRLNGRPATFGQYVGRIAHAIGADALIFYQDNGRPPSSWHAENTHDFMTIGAGIGRIDTMIRRWTDAGQPAPAATA